MGSLVIGVLLGLLASLVIGSIGFIIYYTFDLECETAGVVDIVVTISVCLISTILITIAMCSYDKSQSTCYIDRYNITKQTIEESIDSEKISGMERLQLVQNAIDENKYLKQQQFDCQQWYGFLIDENVLDLEPISFE